MRRTPGEVAGLVAAFVFGGAMVVFGILIVGSLVNLPQPLLWVAALISLIAIGYPLLRVAGAPAPERSAPLPDMETPSENVAAREDRHE